ncbi:MAG: hypothetical protein ACTHOK_03640 [Nocardioidaceae bacterium]
MLDAGGAAGGLDTEIPGDPASVAAVAEWLAGTVAPAVEDGAVALRRAGQEADADWQGEAGSAFSARMSGALQKTTSLRSCVSASASALQRFADVLRSCQDRMAQAREDAATACLQVSGFTVLDPGPGPARPPDRSGELMPVPEAEAYRRQVAAYNRHQQLVDAYQQATVQTGETRTALQRGQQQLADDYKGMSWTDAALNGTDFVAGAVLARLSRYHARILRQDADLWARRSSEWSERMRTTDYRVYQRMEHLLGPDAPQRMFEADAAQQRYLQAQASRSDAAAEAAATEERFGGLAKNVSRGLVGVGIAVDLTAGESVPQAVASNVGGYVAGAAVTSGISAGTSMLAATATGAALGSAVPVVGTAVGAVVGLGVGLFASGAIDSLFENGPDVGEAVSEGWGAVTDTVGAVGDGLSAAGDFIGGLF